VEVARRGQITAEHLDALEKKFFQLVGNEDQIDRALLAKVLHAERPEDQAYVDKIMTGFDDNDDGLISVREFVDAARSLEYAETKMNQKLLVAFAKEDQDGSGEIEINELKILLTNAASQSKMVLSDKDVENMAKRIMKEADVDQNGSMSFEEFATVMRNHPDALKSVGLSEVFGVGNRNRTKEQRCCGLYAWTRCCWEAATWCSLKGLSCPELAVVLTFFALMAVLIIIRCYEYLDNEDMITLFAPLSLCFSRGAAAGIAWCTVWVLLPICRGFVTFLRAHTCSSFPWDSGLQFHQMVGATILILSVVHIVGHIHNYYRILTADWSQVEPVLGPGGSGVFESAADVTAANVFLSGPTVTGFLMVLVFVFAYSCCSEGFRNRALRTWRLCFKKNHHEGSFHLFWYSHHLFLLFLVLVCIHGAWHWLRHPTAWMYVLPLLTVYCIEKLMRGRPVRLKRPGESFKAWAREVSSLYCGSIVAAKQHRQGRKSLELHFCKPPNLRYIAGQYMYLNIPAISKNEWHPFVLTSAPYESELKVNVETVGDWTAAAYHLFPDQWDVEKGDQEWEKARTRLKEEEAEGKLLQTEEEVSAPESLMSLVPTKIQLHLDGPHGAPPQDFTRYSVCVLIGAGIAVTPFAGILRQTLHLYQNWREQREPGKGLSAMAEGVSMLPIDFNLEKMYFHWITSCDYQLEWFKEAMRETCDLDQPAPENMLEMHHYLTRSFNQTEEEGLFKLGYQQTVEAEGIDKATGLDAGKVTTHFERPNWDAIFSQLKALHPGAAKVGVFFAGPRVFTNVLREVCAKHSSAELTFELRPESF